MRVLITNSVPLNGGDEALLRATLHALKDTFPGVQIKVLCKDLHLCRKYISDVDLDFDLEHIVYRRTFAERLGNKFGLWLGRLFGAETYSPLSLLFAPKDYRRIIEYYRNAHVVISSPGGFLHDHYPIEQRLRGFEVALALGRPLIILAQSLGPFWKPESKIRVKEVLARASAIMVRESQSLSHLSECGIFGNQVHITGDMAFYWHRVAPELYREKSGPVRSIAMCFREWPPGTDQDSGIVPKAVKLCSYLLTSDSAIELTFLSTCQGVPEYVSDSRIASDVIDRLPDALRTRCRIDQARYHPKALIQAYSHLDCYIGMRLHGAILSMLGGTPSMAIAYEDKTRGIFSSLGLEAYQVDYADSAESWIDCAQNFFAHMDELRNGIPNVLDEAANMAISNMNLLSDEIAKHGAL